MEDIPDLRDAVVVFHQGNYSRCKKQLKTLSENQKTAPLFIHWLLENNSLAADFQLAHTLKNDLNSFSLKFAQLLKNIQSLPPSKESSRLELAVLHNGLQSDQAFGNCTDNAEWEDALRTTFVRACEVLNRVKIKKVDILGLIEDLLSVAEYQLEITSVCLTWVIGLLHSNSLPKDALRILSMLAELKHKDQKCCGHGLMIQQSCPPPNLSVMVDLSRILLAVLYLKDEKIQECGDLAGKVTSCQYKAISIYVQALSLLHASKPDDALSVLHLLDKDIQKDVEVKIQARLHCVTGRCLAKQDKHQTAILHHKAALELDFNYLLPLYHISESYKELSMDNARLEALNLLVTALDNVSIEPTKPNGNLEDVIMGHVLQSLDSREQFTSVEVQSLLASTCLQLNRYEDAYQRYMDLLSVIVDSQVIKTEGHLIGLPTIKEIFLGAIISSVKSNRSTECLTLCDQALLSLQDELSPLKDGLSPLEETPQSEINQESSELSGKKRKRLTSDEIGENNCNSQIKNYRILYHVYRAEAHQIQGNLSEATTILKSVVNMMEKEEPECVEECPKTNVSHPTKRARLDSDVRETEDLSEHSACNIELSSVYCRLAHLSTLQNKVKQAIHYYRCSLLLQPDNKQAIYHLTSALSSVDRYQEAVTYWLDFRQISSKMDTFQISQEIQNRQNSLKKLKIPNLKKGLIPTEGEVLQKDILILKSLLHHRQTNTWRM